MKPITIVAACIFIAGTANAQSAAKTGSGSSAKRIYKNAAGGTILDIRRQPVAKLQAYLYRNDTLIGSGYTMGDGTFETNTVLPGKYDLRIVYPATGKRITITGVPIKVRTITPVNLIVSEPVEDSTISYTDIAPNTEKKK